MQEEKEDHVELKNAPAMEEIEESRQQALEPAASSSAGAETPAAGKEAGLLHTLLRAGI